MHPRAVIFTDETAVSSLLINLLLQKNISVTVVTADPESWQKKSSLPPSDQIQLLPLSHPLPSASYLFIITLSGSSRLVSQGIRYFQSQTCRLVLALSLLQKSLPSPAVFQEINRLFQDPNHVLKLLFLGELVGPGVPPSSGPAHRFLAQAARSSRAKLPRDLASFYLLSPDFAANTLLKEMFSFGRSQELLLASSVSPANLIAATRLYFPSLEVKFSSRPGPGYYLPQSLSTLSQPFSYHFLADALKTFSPQSSPPAPSPLPPLRWPALTPHLLPKFAPAALVLSWLLALPFVFLFLSVLALGVSYRQLKSSNLTLAKSSLSIAHGSAVLSRNGFTIVSHTPLVGRYFISSTQASLILEKGTKVGQRAINLALLSSDLAQGIFDHKRYDPWQLSEELQLELDQLYKESSFFEGDYKRFGSFLSGYLPEPAQIARYRRYLLSGRDLAQNLPALLGAEKPVIYLVLLQNNLELRPTGGFIGSFALVTFENGKLINTELFDVYTADGQLKGYVEPPSPIINYLGEESWFLRDSNWDPDFPTSARRAEWFLTKSISKEVDGVIGINLDVVASALKYTGPVELADFQDTINHLNIYYRLHQEIEDDFFPGSRKKAHYLTALMNAATFKLQGLPPLQKLLLAKDLLAQLESRDIQIALHDSPSSAVTAVLGWDGSLTPPSCSGNCSVVWTGLVEANLGVNKANYYINRESELTVDFQPDAIHYTLNLLLANQAAANSNLPETSYKTYIRALASPQASFSEIFVYQGQEQTRLSPEFTGFPAHSEAGVLVNLPPQVSKIISFHWTEPYQLDFSQPGQLVFQWRKQAGVAAHPVYVKFRLPGGIFLESSPPFNLTDHEFIGYNTDLSTDLNTTISWK